MNVFVKPNDQSDACISFGMARKGRMKYKDYPDRMTAEQARAFGEDVLNIVSQIPRGKVTTYGHIAVLAGWPSHSRMVGRTLRYSPGAEELPCHRVVNKEGRTAPGWSRQRTLLEEEGVTFKANGHVDMQRHLWIPEEELTKL